MLESFGGKTNIGGGGWFNIKLVLTKKKYCVNEKKNIVELSTIIRWSKKWSKYFENIYRITYIQNLG